MKVKKLTRKLNLAKSTVSSLDSNALDQIQAGRAPDSERGCSVGYNCGGTSAFSAWVIDGGCYCPTQYWPMC